jgi:hypothetical protein
MWSWTRCPLGSLRTNTLNKPMASDSISIVHETHLHEYTFSLRKAGAMVMCVDARHTTIAKSYEPQPRCVPLARDWCCKALIELSCKLYVGSQSLCSSPSRSVGSEVIVVTGPQPPPSTAGRYEGSQEAVLHWPEAQLKTLRWHY